MAKAATKRCLFRLLYQLVGSGYPTLQFYASEVSRIGFNFSEGLQASLLPDLLPTLRELHPALRPARPPTVVGGFFSELSPPLRYA